MPNSPIHLNTEMSDLPPAYYESALPEPQSDECLLDPVGTHNDAPPPEYDFSTVALAAAHTSISTYAAPSATEMATATPPAYSAIAEYPSHDELQDRMPLRKKSKLGRLFDTGKVR